MAIAGALVAGNDEDVVPRGVTTEPAPLPIVQAVARVPAAPIGAATAERPAAPPASAAARPMPTPARLHEIEREVMRLREAGGSDDDAYRLRALALSTAFAAQQAEREAAERTWQHEQAQRASMEAAPQPLLVTE
ncbi:hypothetical protein [Aquabacterium humicola]|uniref:hypothetical protein n=1 Tax=Aquabacterium humicola TaxID=3237377 RepID=UPI00254293D7|nr:hypothetical protein [Rubrivivax pictus]